MNSLEWVLVAVGVSFGLGIAFGAIAVVALSAVQTDSRRGRARRAVRARRMAAFRGTASQTREAREPGGDWAGAGWTRGGWNDTIAMPYRGDDDEAAEGAGLDAGLEDAPPRWPGA